MKHIGSPFLTTIVLALCLASASWARGDTPRTRDALIDGFEQPPAAARPQTLWFWMNGNVSHDGITRDLEAMKRIGLSGALMFDGGTYQPAGPVNYMEPAWREAFAHAVREADRLGLTVSMHNGPGWSSSGGPWITPELSMKELVWSETTVSGGGRVQAALPQPFTQLEFYRDECVLAFPAPPGEERAYVESIARVESSAGTPVDKALLGDGNLDTVVALRRGESLRIEFDRVIDIHGVTAQARPGARLAALRLEVSEDGAAFREVATARNPGGLGIRPPAVRSFPAARTKVVRLTALSDGEAGEVILHRSPRIADWIYKANLAFRPGAQLRESAFERGAPGIDPSEVIDVSSKMGQDGHLEWDAPAGAWVVMRFGYTSTGMRNTAASAAGSGLECDKFEKGGAETHFAAVQARLVADLGDHVGRSFAGVEIDSYEAGMQNWSASFRAEFRRRAGYDATPYLPAMTGRIVGNAGTSERFLFDVRTVQAALMAENYYGRMQELCRQHGLKLYVEGYGSGMFDEMEVSALPDFPMCEFWTRTPWTPNRNVKMVTSAAHTYGKRVIAAEAFTGEEFTSRWLDYPYALKALGDDMFALGVNHFIFHRFAHQPHPDAFPGMAMGPWGFHFDRTNTWFDESSGWIDYLARSQYLLRQGHFVADVLAFVGERPPNAAQMMAPVLPYGYTFDLVDAAVLLERTRVVDGAIEIEGGGRYRILVLPPDMAAATPELMHRLAELVRAGATVVGPQPRFSPTLRGYPESESEVTRLAGELWEHDGFGQGRVIAERPAAEVLRELGLSPDFGFTSERADTELSWAHRRAGEVDIYFVANRQRRTEEIVATFRVAGKQPELWHAERGTVEDVPVFSANTSVTRVPLRLGPSESVFVVFRRPVRGPAVDWVEHDGHRIVDTSDRSPVAPPDVTQEFTMAVWARPDVDLRVMPTESTTRSIDEVGKFYLIHADAGDTRFGAGHATAGLAVGRNGAFVIERTNQAVPAVLVAPMPISGWTHVAVVYRDGVPSLHINGRHVRTGLRSGSIVHPGVGAPAPSPETVFNFTGINALLTSSGAPLLPSQGRSFHFEGNFTGPSLVDRALDGDEIEALFARGLPPPESPASISIAGGAGTEIGGLAWESGTYALSTGERATAKVPAARELRGVWQVAFEAGRGAPERIEMPELRSLHEHPDSGVRHFAGTATYSQTLDVPADWLEDGRRVVLDLGRVEVVAGVYVNGRQAALLWKEPFLADITEFVRPGGNRLDVQVTTLLVNRMIGDQQLPAENAYGTGEERGILKLPEWYTTGRPKPPGGRVTFTTWKFFEADDPLVPSGLLGPVRLRNPVRVQFRP